MNTCGNDVDDGARDFPGRPRGRGNRKHVRCVGQVWQFRGDCKEPCGSRGTLHVGLCKEPREEV